MIKQKKNIIANAYWSFLVIGTVLLLAFCFSTKVSVPVTLRYLLIWCVLLLVIALPVYFVPFGIAGKKLDALMPILVDEADPDRYITELTALLENTKSGMAFQVGLVNLASAYCDKRDFQKALDILNEVRPSSLSMANKTVYQAVRALALFYLGKDEEAVKIVLKNGKTFQQDYRLKNLGAIPSILAVFYNLAKHNRKEAREIYAQARKKWYSPRTAAHFDYLDKELSKKYRGK